MGVFTDPVPGVEPLQHDSFADFNFARNCLGIPLGEGNRFGCGKDGLFQLEGSLNLGQLWMPMLQPYLP